MDDELGQDLLTDIQAAAGITQLEKVEENCSHLRKLYDAYHCGLEGLNSVQLIPVNIEAGELPLYIEVLSPNRRALIEHLEASKIQCRPLPPSLHTSKYFNNSGEYSNSKIFADQAIYLPCGPRQPLENVERVTSAIRHFAEVEQVL